MVFLANEKSIFEFFTQPKFSLSSEPPYFFVAQWASW